MTVASKVNFETYQGSGSAGPFSIGFFFAANKDIAAVKVDSSGIPSVLVDGTHYSVSGAGTPTGGNLTLASALAVGEKLLISRMIDLLQPTAFGNQGDFYPNLHETAFDRLTMMIQQVSSRSVASPAGIVNMVLPGSSPGGYLAWNSGGDALEVRHTGPGYVSTSVSASAYGADLSAAIAAIGAARVRLVVDSPITVNNNCTVPATIQMEVNQPGLLTIAAGKTLNIRGPFKAGRYQVFAGAGLVTFGWIGVDAAPVRYVAEVFPDWFAPDPKVEGAGAVQAAIECAARSWIRKVDLGPGTFVGNFIGRHGVTVAGDGPLNTFVRGGTGADAPVFDLGVSVSGGGPVAQENFAYMGIVGMTIYGGANWKTCGLTNQHGIRVRPPLPGVKDNVVVYDLEGVLLYDLNINQLGGRGIQMTAVQVPGITRFIQNCTLDRLDIGRCVGAGLYISGFVIECRFGKITVGGCGSEKSGDEAFLAALDVSGVNFDARRNYRRMASIVIEGETTIANPTTYADFHPTNMGYMSFPQRLHFESCILNGTWDAGTGWKGLSFYIAAGRQITFKSIDSEFNYTMMRVDTALDYGPAVYDLTLDTWNVEGNAGLTMNKIVELVACETFRMSNVRSPTGSTYTVYIASGYDRVGNVMIDPSCDMVGQHYDARYAVLDADNFLVLRQSGVTKVYNGTVAGIVVNRNYSFSPATNYTKWLPDGFTATIVTKFGTGFVMNKATLAAASPPVKLVSNFTTTKKEDSITIRWDSENQQWVEVSRVLF